MLDATIPSRLRRLFGACLFLGACSSSAVGGSGGAAGTLGLGCAAGDDCDTGLCVLGEVHSWCTQECTVDADCPSAMFCAWIYASSSGRCDPLEDAQRDCVSQCAFYDLFTTKEAAAKCAQACGAVTAAQAGAFVTCSGPELDAKSSTSCLGALCTQAGLTCP